MMDRGVAAENGRTLMVRVPLTLRKRGGRKQVVAPEGASWGAPGPHVDNTMIKAIDRAPRWKRLMESGRFASATEVAEGEKINQSYVSRVLRLPLLAPEIVESILDGRQPAALQLDDRGGARIVESLGDELRHDDARPWQVWPLVAPYGLQPGPDERAAHRIGLHLRGDLLMIFKPLLELATAAGHSSTMNSRFTGFMSSPLIGTKS